jgi:hypothetical protein
MSIIKSALLKIPVDVKSIQKEIEILQSGNWQPHFNKHDELERQLNETDLTQ